MIGAKALLFPFTNPAPSRLAGLLAFFQEIVVFRLPAVQPTGEDEWLSLAAGQGRVTPREVSFFEHKAEAAAILGDFQTWAGQFRDHGDLSFLRGRLSDDTEEPPSRLVQAIRGKQLQKADPDREAQIFLHLVESHDRQQGEIDQLVQRVMEKETLLGDLVGVEDPGGEFETLGPGPRLKTGGDAGSDMMFNRLAAWSRFLEKFGDHQTPLITDHPEAIITLDINLARRIKRDGSLDGRGMEVLEPLFDLPMDAGRSNGAPVLEKMLEPGEPWPQLSSFIDKVASQAWTGEEVATLKAEGKTLIEKEIGPPKDPESPMLTCYLLPGQNVVEAFKMAVGRSALPASLDLFCGPVFELKRV